MYNGKLLFSQIIHFLSRYEFEKCVKKYNGDKGIRSLRCWDQFLAMCFGQLTYRHSIRSIITCLNAQKNKLYHLGFRSDVARKTLHDANEKRDYRIYQDFAQILINRARKLYVDDEQCNLDLGGTVYALDASTIDLCLNVFKWAKFRKKKAAVKIHTLMDLRGNIPVFIHISTGKVHDVNVLDLITFESGAYYVMDKAYIDYGRLYTMHKAGSYFVTRAKDNMKYKRLYSNEVDKSTGLRCDQIIQLTDVKSLNKYPEKMRRVKYYDKEKDKTYVFITNNFEVDAIVIAMLYKERWWIELFFKWIKQHLKIKVFWGESFNAVKTQIWIAICTYVLVAIIKKELKLEQSLYDILQILSISPFDKVGLESLFTEDDLQKLDSDSNQMALELDI